MSIKTHSFIQTVRADSLCEIIVFNRHSTQTKPKSSVFQSIVWDQSIVCDQPIERISSVKKSKETIFSIVWCIFKQTLFTYIFHFELRLFTYICIYCIYTHIFTKIFCAYTAMIPSRGLELGLCDKRCCQCPGTVSKVEEAC